MGDTSSPFVLRSTRKICCIGAGYVGTPTMVMIASKCPDITITIVDRNAERIVAWNSVNLNDFPIYEPGLEEPLIACRGRNLFFSTDVESAIDECDIIYVCVNTPTKKTGLGAGRAANLCPWELAGRTIARTARSNKIIIEKSTVPVKTAEALQSVMECACAPQFVILSNPEFLAEGTAMTDLANPDRVLIGGPRTPAGDYAVKTLSDIYVRWIPSERIITTNLWSSELSKLVANAFLAQRVSSINSVSLLCEVTGADVEEVALAIGTDSRIGRKFLTASVGFGGSCFRKDILNLVYLCEQFGLPEVGQYWNQVVVMNEVRTSQFVRTIVTSMFNTLGNKSIAIFGFAFKKDTSDTRESPAISVCAQLLKEGAILRVYDPRVKLSHALAEFEEHKVSDVDNFSMVSDATQAARGAHAIVVLTEWDAFATLDYTKLFALMEKPAFLFDGRNLLDHQALVKIGFRVKAIGKCV